MLSFLLVACEGLICFVFFNITKLEFYSSDFKIQIKEFRLPKFPNT
jgi:hypothetical protein